ncbi:hypothetical protein DVW02_14885 [Clostridium botulinum]|nr:hypothetical protein [Clostridium botulinum]
MKEIGGYLELDQYSLPILHQEALALNCGRNTLAYIIEARNIKKLCIPYFLCDSVKNICVKLGVDIRYYNISNDFVPDSSLELQVDEWLYVVNYYGQISHDIQKKLVERYKTVIMDYAQAYFEKPLSGIDTIYTCRKFFGVPDGAFLYTDSSIERQLKQDESFDRMHFLLGRYERSANEFYNEYEMNNRLFANEPIKKMSRLTQNLLRGIDYAVVGEQRQQNFAFLNEQFESVNKLHLHIPFGAFMYPLFVEDGRKIRKELQKEKIYVPTLWPNVTENCDSEEIEYKFALDILPLPVDQRYTKSDMKYLVEKIIKIANF